MSLTHRDIRKNGLLLRDRLSMVFLGGNTLSKSGSVGGSLRLRFSTSNISHGGTLTDRANPEE